MLNFTGVSAQTLETAALSLGLQRVHIKVRLSAY